MKRIIFSIYTDDVDTHTSVTDYKRNQFKVYKHLLEQRHKQYAKCCNADYELFAVDETDYDKIQFFKLLKAEELTQYYDEVLYLDFDVIPMSTNNFFERFDLDKLCVYSIPVKLSTKVIEWRNQDQTWHTMDMYSKCCVKNSMLLLNDVVGKMECFNTGVYGVNKQSAEQLNFSGNLEYCHRVFEEAKLDNVYPEVMNKVWRPNNEVYSSFLVELNNIEVTNIGIPWNFILDHANKTPSSASYLIHCVNKDFSILTLEQSL